MGRNQRRSYRCQVAESRRQCKIVANGVTVEGKLQDESVGGFAVLAPNTPQFALHQSIQLHTDCGWFHVRIVYVRDILPPKGVDMATEGAVPWVRLGLCIISQTAHPDQTKASWWLPVASYMNLLKSRLPAGTFAVLGIALILIVAVVPVSLMYLTKDAEPLRGDWLKPVRKLAASVTSKRAAMATTPASPESPSKAASSSKFESDETPTSSADAFERLPGASPFVIPEVETRLKLTDDQKKQIRGLLQLTSTEMLKIEKKADSLEPQQIQHERRHLLNQIRRKVLGLLTDDQVEEWEKMTARQ